MCRQQLGRLCRVNFHMRKNAVLSLDIDYSQVMSASHRLCMAVCVWDEHSFFMLLPWEGFKGNEHKAASAPKEVTEINKKLHVKLQHLLGICHGKKGSCSLSRSITLNKFYWWLKLSKICGFSNCLFFPIVVWWTRALTIIDRFGEISDHGNHLWKRETVL